MIKIKNIYYMLAYAFQVLNEDSYAKIETEEFENIGDLLAAILAKGVANQIKRGLGREYISKSDTLFSPTGKLDISASIKQNTMIKKQLVCSFDEFTENAYMNKIIKTTAFVLIHSNNVSIQQKKALRKVMLYFSNVDTIEPRDIQWSSIKYHRNNATYRMLMNICYMVIEGMLLSEKEGRRTLSKYLDDQRMNRLYEKFVLEYYRRHYPEMNASASHIAWDVDDGIIDLLPAMKSDITLVYRGRTLIIDTKYYSRTMSYHGIYESRTLHSNNLYQIFTYVKNKDIGNTGNVGGVLLYAMTDEEIIPDNDYMMNGNRISVKTLDLNREFSEIAARLDNLADNYFIFS